MWRAIAQNYGQEPLVQLGQHEPLPPHGGFDFPHSPIGGIVSAVADSHLLHRHASFFHDPGYQFSTTRTVLVDRFGVFSEAAIGDDRTSVEAQPFVNLNQCFSRFNFLHHLPPLMQRERLRSTNNDCLIPDALNPSHPSALWLAQAAYGYHPDSAA